jgi:membrane protein
VWLVGIVAYLSLLGGLRVVVGNGAALALFGVAALTAAMALWWVTPWVMLGRQVRFRVLAPTALLTGLGMTVYGASASIWMPRTVSQNESQFGFFGVALSMVTWLSGAALIIVTAACAGTVLAEDSGRVGHLVRGVDPALLVPGAAPALRASRRSHAPSEVIDRDGDDPA